MIIGRVVEEVKDLIFPYFCAGCGSEGEWWCKRCRKSQIKFQKRAEGELKDLTALFKYQENSSIGKLIKDFKYGFVSDISKLWKDIINECKIEIDLDAVLVPVPLYEKRERERGYNQSQIIAKIIMDVCGCRVDNYCLERVRQTLQQAHLGLEERLLNVENAFRAKEDINYEKVILVDDVFTTGATMNECARVLRRAGVKEVSGFVLARG